MFFVLISCSCGLTISVTPLNISNLISKELYNSNKKGDKLGIISPYENIQKSYELCSIQPEKTKELRSVFPTNAFYDVYLNNSSRNEYPAILDNNERISMLCLPKSNYTNSFFDEQYQFDLLVGSTNNYSNTQDLYITKEYADYLLKNETNKDYSLLINKEIQLGYLNKYISDITKLTYTIKGVINTSSDSYAKYKMFIGEYFICNQYLSLPISNNIIFDIPAKQTKIKELVDYIVSLYDYAWSGYENLIDRVLTIRQYNDDFKPVAVYSDKGPVEYSALELTYTYDMRIYTLDKNSTINNALLDNIYNFYLNKEFVIPMVVGIVLLGFETFFAIWLLFKKYCIGIYQTIITSLFAFVPGLLLCKLFLLLVTRGIFTSLGNYLIFVLYLCSALLVLLFRRKMPNNLTKKS